MFVKDTLGKVQVAVEASSVARRDMRSYLIKLCKYDISERSFASSFSFTFSSFSSRAIARYVVVSPDATVVNLISDRVASKDDRSSSNSDSK